MSNSSDGVGLKGSIIVEKVSPNSDIEVREINNTITNAGRAQVAGLILSDYAGTAFDYIGIGTGNTAPNVTQTALVSQAYRTTGAGTRITTSVANDTAQLSSSFSITSSVTIREIGIFNSSSSGVMLGRATFSDISATNGDTINAVYRVQAA